MSKSVMLSLLAQGNTGDEILSILDTLTAENVSGADDTEGTGSVIDFWCLRARGLTLCAPYVRLGDISETAVIGGGFLWRRGGVAYIIFRVPSNLQRWQFDL